MAKPATTPPSGLTIARDNLKFTFTWKIGEKDGYVRQHYHWKTNLTDWTAVEIGNTVTSKSVTLTASDYYPTTSKKLTTVSFRVRAIRSSSYEWTGWVQKDFNLAVPNVPSLTATLDGSSYNKTTFAWSTATKTDDNKPFTNVEYQTRYIKENNETDGSKLAWNSNCGGWATSTSTASSSNARTESTSLLAAASYTRWFRVRSRGPAGASAWRYAKHVYALPYKANITGASSSVASGVTTMNVSWTANQNASHPIDIVTVQYSITTPATGVTVPNNASWSDAVSLKDTAGTDAARAVISDAVDTDECLFTRIMTEHDPYDTSRTYSNPKLVQCGPLAAPTSLSVSTDNTTYRATVTATNNSTVADSRLAIVYRTNDKNDKDFVIGIIAHGQSSATVQCPNWTGKQVSFGVYAFVGDAESSVRADSVGQYAVTAKMKSSTLWDGGTVPVAPAVVKVTASDEREDEVIVQWRWSWASATRAEVSWSDNPNAWESTEEPSTYEVPNTHAAKWRISGLEMGKKYYFCVRLIKETDGEITYGPYSDPEFINLAYPPEKPVITIAEPIVQPGDKVTVAWEYISGDGTPQHYAEIQVYADGTTPSSNGSIYAHVKTQKYREISTDSLTAGTIYYVRVRTESESWKMSEWSDPVPVIVAPPPTINVTQTSLANKTVNSRTVLSLKALPMTVTVTGAGEGGTTTVIIERVEGYHVIRPDDSEFDGYAGETVAIVRQNGEAQMSIGVGDLIGTFDDGARYKMIAMVEDGYGQAASSETEFEVHWDHAAGIPTATAVMDGTVAKITPTAPTEYASGDVCDIYRLSADKPELIVYGGSFGTTYVDPYPAIGEAGGHRVVHRTYNNDYITSANKPAWTDLRKAQSDYLDINYALIDFGGEQLEIHYNEDFSNNFEKDFLATSYLGGSVRGDWNPGTKRSAAVNAVIEASDLTTFTKIRRLAAFDGICHVRTQDGSSYAADVQVGDALTYETAGKAMTYSLTITRVDPEGYDGVPLSQWQPNGTT